MCEHLGLLVSTLGSDKLMVDDYFQEKGGPKKLVDPSSVPIHNTHKNAIPL